MVRLARALTVDYATKKPPESYRWEDQCAKNSKVIPKMAFKVDRQAWNGFAVLHSSCTTVDDSDGLVPMHGQPCHPQQAIHNRPATTTDS
jgi:hypothetical protein